ncbi:hypothetical protein [Fulvimonas yonginensis]|uniref:CHRD domain-containing protein n=1 Tax=Fulvimonas yonginensis TaxID=1495200 RepID=A0ABU8JDG3_9GAMM
MRSALKTRPAAPRPAANAAMGTGGNGNAASRHARSRALLTGSAALVLALCLPGLALAATCSNATLKGRYTFATSGFTRPPFTPPGTPWVPKAIVETLRFDGAGGVTALSFTAANPFGDLGITVQGTNTAGTYAVQPDCNGTVQFADTNATAFAIHLGPWGNTIYMIQTNPNNNVFEGVAKRSW